MDMLKDAPAGFREWARREVPTAAWARAGSGGQAAAPEMAGPEVRWKVKLVGSQGLRSSSGSRAQPPGRRQQ